jgi:hypothetical protein
MFEACPFAYERIVLVLSMPLAHSVVDSPRLVCIRLSMALFGSKSTSFFESDNSTYIRTCAIVLCSAQNPSSNAILKRTKPPKLVGCEREKNDDALGWLLWR